MSDPWLDRIVVLTLALTSLMGGVGMTTLALRGQTCPPELAAIVGGAVGVMVGWFSRGAGTHGPDAPDKAKK